MDSDGKRHVPGLLWPGRFLEEYPIKYSLEGEKDVDDYPSSNAGNPRERQALCALPAASFCL